MENITFQLLNPEEMGVIKGAGQWVYDQKSGEWLWIDNSAEE